MRLPISGMRLSPKGVREYSTLGGISAKDSRDMSPSDSRFFKVTDNTLGEISGIAFSMMLNLEAGFSARIHRTSIVHFPENRDIIFLTGHSSMCVNFFRFS